MAESGTARCDLGIRNPPQLLEPPQQPESSQQPESPKRADTSQLVGPRNARVSERPSFRAKPVDDFITYPVDFVSWPKLNIKILFPPLVNRPTQSRADGVLPQSIEDISDLAMFRIQNLIFSLFDMERKTKDKSLSFLVSTRKPCMPLSVRKAPNLKDGEVSRICQVLSSGSWDRRNISIIGQLVVTDQDWNTHVCKTSDTPILVFVDLDKAEKNVMLAIPEAYKTAWDAFMNGGPHEPHSRANGGLPQFNQYHANPFYRCWNERAGSNIKELERARGLADGHVRMLMNVICFSDLGPDIKRQPDLSYTLVDLGPYARLPAARRLQEGEPKVWMKFIRPYPVEEKWRLSFTHIYTLPQAFRAPHEDEIGVLYKTLMERVPAPEVVAPET